MTAPLCLRLNKVLYRDNGNHHSICAGIAGAVSGKHSIHGIQRTGTMTTQDALQASRERLLYLASSLDAQSDAVGDSVEALRLTIKLMKKRHRQRRDAFWNTYNKLKESSL